MIKKVLKLLRPLGFIAASSLLLFQASSVAGQEKKEALDVIGAKCDFGYVPYGTIVKHRATLINQSDTVVNITRVVPGCGCTQIPLKTKVLKPGDSLEVEMTFETGKIHPGQFEKSPAIYTDNRETPRVTFHIFGFNLKSDEPQPPIRVEPKTISFTKGGSAGGIRVEIYNGGSRNVFPHLVDELKSPYVDVEMPIRQIVPGKKEIMTVKLQAAKMEISRSDESITLVFNDAKQTRWTIPITIN